MQAMNAVNLQTLDGVFGEIAMRHNGTLETVFYRFLQTFLAIGHWAHFTCQSQFTKHDQIGG